MSIWPKTPFLCSPWTLQTGWAQGAWSGIDVQTWGSRGCGSTRRCHSPKAHSMAGWWMWCYSLVLASDVTPFLLLVAWQMWFSKAPEPVGTWGARFSQWRDFLLQFSSAPIVDCGPHELQLLLHPFFYVQLSFGVQKAFHVLILWPYWIHFKNTFFFFPKHRCFSWTTFDGDSWK